MSEKIFKIVSGDISDGYHTFDELYEHRCLLFIAWMISDGCPGNAAWVADHFDGWDLIACDLPGIGQISYHVPAKYRHLYQGVIPPAKQIPFDGHTSADVVKRIQQWITR